MSETEILAVVVEWEFPFPPEKIWRALTQPHLIAEWLMTNDFQAQVGHDFRLSADWGSVDCRVRTVEPHRALSYSWDTKDLVSVVSWTLTPTSAGTVLRMEQSGFRQDQQPYYRGAQVAWPRFLANLEQVLARMG
ncbi:SRPBCC domain-containing protein [Aurantimonas sp. A2-1-M11]|uniref:SRPBCC family protein n=1 Tax=Aurantimonas sp. A2-1-M11 TaxID=3113712 RepID=UPI002F92305C